MSKLLYTVSILHLFTSYLYLRWLPGRILFPINLTLFIIFCSAGFLEWRSSSYKATRKSKVSKEKVGKHGKGPKELGSRRSVVGSEVDAVRTTRSKVMFRFNMILQLLVLMMVLDFTFTSRLVNRHEKLSFSRVTWVDYQSAHIFIRYPVERQSLVVEYRLGGEKESFAWEASPPFSTSRDHDYTKIIRLENLKPSTLYRYRFKFAETEVTELQNLPLLPVSLEKQGEFWFTTSPPPYSPTSLYFGVGSCIKPDFPYSPISNKGVKGFDALRQFNFQLLLFLGDFIYADAPFYFGPSLDSYRQFYRQMYGYPSIRSVAEATPIYHAYDDHEILNNWDRTIEPPFENAITAFNEYQGAGPFLNSPLLESSHSGETSTSYYNMTYGDIGFFFWDTRKYRSSEKMNDGPSKTMLGLEQKAFFKKWIKDTLSSFKLRLVISSVPLTYNWVVKDSSKDTWKGYRHEREELLEFLKDVPNLFFFSGDRHEVAAVNLPYNKLEFSLSPFNQFYGPIQTFRPQGPSSEFDPTLLYYRHGNIKFGGIYADTHSRKDGRPLVAVTVYSDQPDRHHDNYFDPAVLSGSIVHPNSFHTNISSKVASNFDFLSEPGLKSYLENHFFSNENENTIVAPVFHLFWLGDA